MGARLELFELVKSLSASEKRYFRLFSRQHRASGENEYMVLFDALESMQELDMQQLKDSLVRANPGYQLGPNQAYLHKMILKAMRAYTSESTPSGRMNEMIKDISFLEAKGHYHSANKSLEKALELAREKGFLNFQMELLRISQRLVGVLHSKDLRSRMEEVIEEKRVVMHRVKNEQELSNLFSSVMVLRREMGQQGAAVSKETVQLALHEGMPLIDVDALTLQGKAQWLMLMAILAELEGRPELALEHSLGIRDIWNQERELVLEQPQLYRISLSNMMVWAFRLQRWDLFPETLAAIEALPPSNPRDEAELFQNSKLLHLLYLMNTEQLEAAFKILPSIEQGLHQHASLINLSRRLTLQYNAAVVAFFTRHHKEALRWIQFIQDEKTNHTRKDILDFSHTLQLMTHFDLGNHDLLEYSLRNWKRRQPTAREETPDTVAVAFMERAITGKPAKQKALVKEALQQLAALPPAVASRTGGNEVRMWLEGMGK